MLNIVNYKSAEIDISIFSYVLCYDLIIPFWGMKEKWDSISHSIIDALEVNWCCHFFHVVQVYAYTLAIKTTLLDQLLFILIFPHSMLSILIWKQILTKMCKIDYLSSGSRYCTLKYLTWYVHFFPANSSPHDWQVFQMYTVYNVLTAENI